MRPIQDSICSRSFPVYLRYRNNDRTDWNAHPRLKIEERINHYNLNERGTLHSDTLSSPRFASLIRR